MDDFNAAWGKGYEIGRLAGWQLAVDEHSGLVAAAVAVIDAFNDSHKPFEDRMLTLESALNNLMSILSKED